MIGEVARRLGVATSTLRYYESEGLLAAVERTSGGRRQFSQRDVEACRVIECLKRSGLSIKEIKNFMDIAAEGDASLARRLELFRARKESVQREVAELERVVAVLDFKIWYYEQAAEAGAENLVRSLPLEQIPERHRPAQAYVAGADLNEPL
ncbi:MerR family transcriptional regulator [Actinomyces timonensis]|uniref:MerR family transcriptional regulator n=1 Tax=Actinomyces timonensis TaxID=1288391 RepID=A0AAU8N4D1_9ACTO